MPSRDSEFLRQLDAAIARRQKPAPIGFNGLDGDLREVARAFGVSMHTVLAEAHAARLDRAICSLNLPVVEVVAGLPRGRQEGARLSLTAACRAYVRLRCEGRTAEEAKPLLDLALMNIKVGNGDPFGLLANR